MKTENIKTKQDFINFLNEFKADLQNNPTKWENNTLENFLEALSAYTKDIAGYYKNMNINVKSEQASWRQFADIFMGARIYE